MTEPSTPRRIALAAVLDIVAALAFVVIGREEHEGGSGLGDIAETAAPFLIGLVVAWAATRPWRHPFAIRTGQLVVAVTVVIGMALRATVFDEGIAIVFIIVTTLFLGVTMIGWRFVATKLSTRRHGHT